MGLFFQKSFANSGKEEKELACNTMKDSYKYFNIPTTTPIRINLTMNIFCGMTHQLKTLSLISSCDHCQRSSPS